MSVYTRTGDTGTTSLFGGKRILKCEELVDVYGSLDELNSWVGFIAAQIAILDVQHFLGTIQKDLIAIGSSLAGWKGYQIGRLEKRIQEMEARIDLMEQELPAIKNFILPGGSQLGSLVHVVRSICRRVERQVVSLAQKQKIEQVILKYLNRLSDLLFLLARVINKQSGSPEVIWSSKS